VLLGRGGEVQRLTDSLRVDIAETRAIGWQPGMTPRQGIEATVRWWRTQ
jgi:nucleoside-diphosphate-sugar epimerase